MNWKTIAGTALMVGLLSTSLWACSSSDDGDDDGVAGMTAAGTGAGVGGGSGGGAGGASGGAGGAGGARAGAGGGGAGGSMAMPIDCNGMQCTPIMTAAGTTLMPCCDASMGMACGAITDTMGGCTARKQMGTLDASCPNAMSLLGSTVMGCCRPDGMCGLLSATLENSCVERSKYPIGFLGGTPPPTMPLPSQACGGDADAGM